MGEIKKSSSFSTKRDEPDFSTEGSEWEVGEEDSSGVWDNNRNNTWKRNGIAIEDDEYICQVCKLAIYNHYELIQSRY